MSSLRQKGHHGHTQGHSHHNQSWQAPYGGRPENVSTVQHPATSHSAVPQGNAQGPRDEGEEGAKPQIPPKRRHKRLLSNGSYAPSTSASSIPPDHQDTSTLEGQQVSKLSQSLDPVFSHHDSHEVTGSAQGYVPREHRRSVDRAFYNPTPGNFSSLPRASSQSSVESTRGTKPYSSARYPSSSIIKPHPVPSTPEKKKLSLSRNASFHGTGEKMIVVSPLDRNPTKLSEETDDDSYLYRKASTGSHSGPNYENMTKRSSDATNRSYSSTNYQNVTIAGVGSPVPLPLPRRTHEVILEDPSATPTTMEWESKNNKFLSTFPRRVPSRTQSMNMHGDTRTIPRRPSLPRDYEWQETEKVHVVSSKTVSLRRGASLHGTADIPGGGKSLPSIPKQHRRTQSYETGQKTACHPVASGEVWQNASKRSISEYYPSAWDHQEKGEGEEGRADQLPLREDQVESSSPASRGAVGGAGDLSQDASKEVGPCTIYYFISPNPHN